MAATGAATVRQNHPEPSASSEAASSGVSWAAVFAGAFATAALSLALMTLGAGVGLSSLSPWPNAAVSTSRVSAGALIWLIAIQIAASALGGYLAGRLRTKWVSVHTHEVYFRDTAHGFLVWAVALVMSSIFFAFYTFAMMGASRTTTPVENQGAGAEAYFVDSLFRTDHPSAARNDGPARSEAAVILANALLKPDMSPADQSYLTSLVVATTGLSQPEAEQRVTNTLTAARQAADEVRKAVAHSLYWLFVALLIGAFCGSYATTIGGRQRDHVPVV